MSYKTLNVELSEKVATIAVNRPEAMNALNATVIAELSECLDEVADNSDVLAIIITGAGEKSFVAGADIKEMLELDADGAKELSLRGQETFNRIEAMNKPVIAAVNGFALGGGFELALACDFIVASEKARFGLPEVGLGLIPGYGGTQRLSRVVGLNHARLMAMSGEMFSAEQLLNFGAVSEVCKPEDLMPCAFKWASKIASKGPVAVGLAKQAILHGFDQEIRQALNTEADYFSDTFKTQDCREGIAAFVEKRKANFQGK